MLKGGETIPIRLTTTARSGQYARTPDTLYVLEHTLPAGKEYVADLEAKEITFPGQDKPTKMKDVKVREYPEPNRGYFTLDWLQPSGFIIQAVAFLVKE